METSPLVGNTLREANLPADVIVGALVRDGQVIILRADTMIKNKDNVILLAAAKSVKKVEKLFSVQLEFF